MWSALEGSLHKKKGKVVKVKTGKTKKIHGFRMLLPIDYTKINKEGDQPYGSLMMGTSYGVDDLISSVTMEAAIINNLDNYKKP